MTRPNPGPPPSEDVWKREYLSSTEAAGLTGIGASTWRAWCAAGRIPGATNLGGQRGRQWMIPRAEVEKHERKEEKKKMLYLVQIDFWLSSLSDERNVVIGVNANSVDEAINQAKHLLFEKCPIHADEIHSQDEHILDIRVDRAKEGMLFS